MTKIIIYKFTGKQGFFTVPKKFCEECDLLEDKVKKTIAELELENKVSLTLRPWWLWSLLPFVTRGAWHAPILIINGKVVSQGIVPDRKTLVKVLTSKKTSSGQQTLFSLNTGVGDARGGDK